MTALHKKLKQAKRAAEGLSLPQLQALEEHIHDLVAALKRARRSSAKHISQAIKERHVGSVTYRLQRVKCGKADCKCAAGEGHGPYWYAFWREGNRVRSKYIGKVLKREE